MKKMIFILSFLFLTGCGSPENHYKFKRGELVNIILTKEPAIITNYYHTFGGNLRYSIRIPDSYSKHCEELIVYEHELEKQKNNIKRIE